MAPHSAQRIAEIRIDSMQIYREHKDRSKRIQSAITAINAILPLDLYAAHKRELIDVCIWKITEADGKHKVKYWSEGALSQPESAVSKPQHEHVYTRKELVSRLLCGENVEIVVQDAIGCMVTEKEHEILSRSLSSGWQRYKDVGIRVFDSKDGTWRW